MLGITVLIVAASWVVGTVMRVLADFLARAFLGMP
jgi:hypothetical protein